MTYCPVDTVTCVLRPLTFVFRHFTCQVDLPPGIRTAGCYLAVQLEVPREMYFDIDQVCGIVYI